MEHSGNGSAPLTSSPGYALKICIVMTDVVVLVCWTWPTREDKIDSDDVIEELEQYLKTKNIPYLFTCADNYMITGRIDYTNWYMFPPAEESWLTTTPRG